MKLKQQQSGFTLIELVVVIVILGILAATAIPKFVDLSEEAESAATKGVAANIASALSINYAACAAKGFVAEENKCVEVEGCVTTQLEKLMQDATTFSGSDAKYTIRDYETNSHGKVGSQFYCLIKGQKGEEVKFSGIRTLKQDPK